MITASTWDGLTISGRLAPGYSRDRFRLEAKPCGDGMLAVSVVERTPQEAAQSKRARRAVRRSRAGLSAASRYAIANAAKVLA